MCDLGGAEQVDRALIDSNHFVVVWQKRVSLVSPIFIIVILDENS